MSAPPIWASLVGTAFRDKGRDERGLDCWGLVWLVHKLMGNALPLHGEATFRNTEEAAAYITGAAAEGWLHVKRAEEQAFDMAVLSCPVKSDGRWVRLDSHVGLVTAPGRLLHCEEKTGVVHLPFDHHTVAKRISRIYRHEAFA